MFDGQLLTLASYPSLISPTVCFTLYFLLFFLSPTPTSNFFVQRTQFHLRGLWERRPLDWPLPCTDALNLRSFSACEGVAGRDGGGGEETCLYFLGIRRQMGALRGGPGSLPPWLAGKVTPV